MKNTEDLLMHLKKSHEYNVVHHCKDCDKYSHVNSW